MMDCNYNEMGNGCPIPCKTEVIKGFNVKLNGFGNIIPSNEMRMMFTFSTMDIEHQNEVFIQDTFTFIGAVEGSLGFFIGFSFTGFIGQLINCFIKDKF